jgi:hypothetical protein
VNEFLASSAPRPVSSGTSFRSADRQLGSSPTIGVPAANCGASTRNVRFITARATESCPVDTHVRPQHTEPAGSTGLKPAARSTRVAAMPTDGLK